MKIKYRSILEIVILSLVTFGIYHVIWFYKTKNELNYLGARIPNFILFFIPFANIYFLYKYAQGFSEFIKEDDNMPLYLIILVYVPFISMIYIQDSLNKFTEKQSSSN